MQSGVWQVDGHVGSRSAEEDSLFELISRSQSRRIDDQRCSARHLTPRSGSL